MPSLPAIRLAVVAAALLALVPAGPRAEAADPAPAPVAAAEKKSPITFELTPYLWLGNLEGTVGTGMNSADIDYGFDEVLDDLDFGAMVSLEAREGPWGFLFDAMYLRLSDDADTGNPTYDEAEVSVDELVLGGALAYRVADDGAVRADMLAGVRYWEIDTEVELESDVSPDLEVDDSEYWLDPVVGGRLGFDLGSNFFVVAYGDVGGFDVGSDLTWQVIGTIGYRFSEAFSASVGYRYLDVDYEDDDFVFDTVTAGFIAGVTFSF